MFLQYIPRFLSPQHINIYNFEVNSYAFNSFHVYGLFRYPLKTTENLRFSDVFRGYRSGTLVENGLTNFSSSLKFQGSLLGNISGLLLRSHLHFCSNTFMLLLVLELIILLLLRFPSNLRKQWFYGKSLAWKLKVEMPFLLLSQKQITRQANDVYFYIVVEIPQKSNGKYFT